MNIKEAVKALSEKIQDVRCDEVMAAHTSFKVGGKADIMVLPQTECEIEHTVKTLADSDIPMFVMGKGTNLLVTRKGIRGVVLKIADSFSGMEFEGEAVTVKSGTSLAVLTREAIKHSLGGAEFLGGIPGTLGGAVYMNAGAYGGEIGDHVEEVYLASRAGAITLSKDEMDFGYRRSILFKMPLVVTGAKLKLKKCDAEDSKCRFAELNGRRRDKQPLEFPSAGSTFKRPEGYYAGALIEQAGLKGFTVGGAQVSEKHAGFVINKGDATPEDILTLINEVQKRVKEHSGVTLETEVKVVGEQ